MHEFRITTEGAGSTEYVVLKCPDCGRVQRFMHRQECFGKVPKNAGCKQCQKPIPIETCSLDEDPLPVEKGERVSALRNGRWEPYAAQKKSYSADFTTADKI